MCSKLVFMIYIHRSFTAVPSGLGGFLLWFSRFSHVFPTAPPLPSVLWDLSLVTKKNSSPDMETSYFQK